MHKGEWVNTTNGSLRSWQVPRCIFHNYYTLSDITACLAMRDVVFLGDSTTREVFLAMARKLEKNAEQQIDLSNRHQDLKFGASNITLRFVWDPFMNSTLFQQWLEIFMSEEGSPLVSKPAILFIGGGLWHARHLEGSSLSSYKKSIDIIQSKKSNIPLGEKSSGSWSLSGRDFSQDLLLVSPVQLPFYSKLSEGRALSMTPSRIDPLNNYLHLASAENKMDVLWSYSELSPDVDTDFMPDGIHHVTPISDMKADILLNLRCNGLLNAKDLAPFRGTCCSDHYKLTWLERLFLAIGGLLLPLSTIILGNSRYTTIFRSVSVFTLAIVMCFFADRTQVFDRVSKRFVSTEFNVMVGIVFFLGCAAIRTSRTPPRTPQVGLSEGVAQSFCPPALAKVAQPFLSRDQTDEWKGWMQFVILIYHYTGASKVLWIYKIVRLLVSSYLFMTGFGHTCYFLRPDADFSLGRLASVLLRTNLLAVSLAYVMRTNYLFYYFAPLSSFWFIVVFLTMRAGHGYSTSSLCIVAKIFVSAAIVSRLILSPDALEQIFAVLTYAFNIHWDVNEWRFRVSLDIFIVYVGMLVGVAYRRTSLKVGRRIQLVCAIASVSVIILFLRITSLLPDKYIYNAWHPYISPFPILAYVILRNSFAYLRSFYSYVFVWLGRCSLETFTLQYHLWLAADTRGLLSTGLFVNWYGDGRLLDLLVLTPIFLWISHHVANATSAITVWLVGPQPSIKIGERSIMVFNWLEGTKEPMELGTMKNATELCKWARKRQNRRLRVRLGLFFVLLCVCNWTYVLLWKSVTRGRYASV